MFTKTFTSAVVALAASGLVSAQTFTDCNPLKRTCDPDEALGNKKANCDFTQGACSVFDELPGTTISYDDKGALFSIEKEAQAPTIATHKRIFFGKVEVELQAALGQGIITSVVLESKDLDEVDWEWVGNDNVQVQSNYYGKGDTTTYDRVGYHEISSPLTTFHTYTIEWTSKALTWSIDGNVVRTLAYEEAQGGSRYPQTPMEVKVGTWVGGGKNSPKGTVEWAGGYADFSQAPFNAWYKSISIVDYAGGDSPATDAVKEYVWTDNTGSWESIKVVKGDGSSSGGDDDEDDEEKTTTTSAEKTESTKTTEAPKSKTTSTDDDDDDEKSTTTTSERTATTSEASTTTTSASTFTSASTSASVSETTTPSSTDAAPQESETEDPGSAAAGVFGSLSRVAAAGIAAVLLAQAL